MGNLFEPESPPKVEEQEKAQDYLTKEERSLIRDHFNTVRKGTTWDFSVLMSIDDQTVIDCIGKYLEKHNISTLSEFEFFIIDAVRVSPSKSLEVLWEMATLSNISSKTITSFCYLVISMSLLVSKHDVPNRMQAAEHLTEFFLFEMQKYDLGFKFSETTTLADIHNVINKYASNCAKCFQSIIAFRFLDAKHSVSYKGFAPINLLDPSEIITSTLLAPLSLYTDDLQGNWKRLFCTSTDGISYNRILHQILGYDGPTCLIIRCANAERTIFGALSVDHWKETNRFYGSSRNLLFSLSPKLRIYPTKIPSNSAYQWLNSSSFGMPHGIGFGGTLEGFRVFIPDSLENCYARPACPTYELGKLVDEETFEIDAMEVWGCGGVKKITKALVAQKEARAVTDETINRARKVDKAAFFDNSFDREFLLPNTFSHHKEMLDRPDEC